MARFGLEYQPFYSLRKETMVASIFATHHRLIIYMVAYNMIPKKSGHGKVRKSNIYFLDYMFHNRNSPYAHILLPNIIISYIRSMVRWHPSFFKLAFSCLLSLVFKQVGINLNGVTQVAVRPA